MLVGVGQESYLGPTTTCILKQVTVVGSWIFELEDWPDMTRIAGLARTDIAKIITCVTTPQEAERAFAGADLAESGKTVFLW